ncbi:MAG TPA: S8 family serine peptidase, partial [Myxococcota bacterium]|nr:S8 family serine peptidase [Myxococcota bacterium]
LASLAALVAVPSRAADPAPARPGLPRLAPELLPLLSGQTRPGGPIILRALTRPGAAPEPALQAVRHLLPPRGFQAAGTDAAGWGWVWLRVGEDEVQAALESLAARPDLAWIERYVPMQYLNDNSSWLIQSGDEEVNGRSIWRHGLTGTGQVAGVADSGLDADACQFRLSGEPGAVTTSAIFPQPPLASEPALGNKVLAYYLIGSAEAYDDAAGGFHGTHTTGNVAGDNYMNLATPTAAGHDAQDGMAPGARIVFQDIGAHDGSLRGLMGVSMYDLFKQAYQTGARVHNNSYGSSVISIGYDADSASIDRAAWELNDLLVVFAAGNAGSDDQGNPVQRSLGGTGSTAKNSLVLGGSGPVELDIYGSIFRLQEDLLVFSSQGPTGDNRLKPDLVAPGMVFSASSDEDAAVDLGCCDVYGNPKRASNNQDGNCDVDSGWGTFGTSFSSPIAVGAALLARQYFVEGYWRTGVPDPQAGFNPTNALLKAVLINGAKPLTGAIRGMGDDSPLTQPPSVAQGWGRVHLDNALTFQGDTRIGLVLTDVPNPAPQNPMLTASPAPFPEGGAALGTGDERTWELPLAASDQPLKLTLAWSDPPAAAGALPALVNDLDLELVAPNGEHFLGNQEFDEAGFSMPDWRGDTDQRNNVECVFLAQPDAGAYQVRVRARSVPGNGDPGSDAQGYALFVSAGFLAPRVTSLEPSSAAPGDVLELVEVHGQDFAPGMQLDLGPDVAFQSLEVVDAGLVRLTGLAVSPTAELGPRDAIASHHALLTSVAEDAFEVASPGGAGCGCGGAGAPAGLAGLAGLALALRPRSRSRQVPRP